MVSLDELNKKIKEILPEITKIRHDLHKIPEIAGKEYKTSAFIRQKLLQWNLEVKPPFLETDVIAFINVEKEKNLTFRADIDALPICEDNADLSYRSVHPGMMHACGHDGHAAMLLGAAKILSEIKQEISCSIRFLFQPGEEMASLAKNLLESGALYNPEPDFITGLHNWPGEEYGKINTKAGVLMAAAGFFRIMIYGKGGHGSLPHLANNPLDCAAEIMINSKNIVPDDCVLTFCSCRGGNCNNVIPDTAELLGTIRFLDHEKGKKLLFDFENTIRQIAEQRKLNCDFYCPVPYIPLINRAENFEKTKNIITRTLGQNSFFELPAHTMSSEDFSWYLAKYPGVFCHLGAGKSKPLHSSGYDFDDNLLEFGIRYFCLMALNSNELVHRRFVTKVCRKSVKIERRN